MEINVRNRLRIESRPTGVKADREISPSRFSGGMAGGGGGGGGGGRARLRFLTTICCDIFSVVMLVLDKTIQSELKHPK